MPFPVPDLSDPTYPPQLPRIQPQHQQSGPAFPDVPPQAPVAVAGAQRVTHALSYRRKWAVMNDGWQWLAKMEMPSVVEIVMKSKCRMQQQRVF